MWLVPYAAIELTSELSFQATWRMIAENIDEPHHALNIRSRAAFAGIAIEPEFRVRRIVRGYINSFNPVIRGRVVQSGATSLVRLRFFPPLAAWLTIAILLAIFGIEASFQGRLDAGFACLILGAYAIVLIAFHIEVRSARRAFIRLLQE